MYKARISGVGTYAPPRVLTNADLEKMVETSNEWILDRTGIAERRMVEPGWATSDMSLEAARMAMAQAGVSAAEIDVILVCTVTPDFVFPATACLVQDRLGANKAWGFDLQAACSGFLYGLTVAGQMVHADPGKKILVIGADTMSAIVDYSDRTTCVLFGDGAGAFVVEHAEEADFLSYANSVDGSGAHYLHMPAGGSRRPPSVETVTTHQHYIKQDGQKVFKFAVNRMCEISEEAMAKAGIKASDVKMFIPHQANKRIITAVAERLGFRDEQVMINIQKYGNTTGGTIPLATGDALLGGCLEKGDLVLFAAVGAGLTVGANVWRWGF